MFWPSTTEPSGPVGWQFGALKRSKKITSPERTSRDCLLIRTVVSRLEVVCVPVCRNHQAVGLARSSPARIEKTRPIQPKNLTSREYKYSLAKESSSSHVVAYDAAANSLGSSCLSHVHSRLHAATASVRLVPGAMATYSSKSEPANPKSTRAPLDSKCTRLKSSAVARSKPFR